MIAALGTAIVVLGVAAWAGHTGPTLPFDDRLRLALHADVFVVAWLAAAIANVARLRFFSAQDIAGSSADDASHDVRTANAILQNTFEQAALAIVTHLIVAATFERSVPVVYALVGLFVIGRLLFWTGYTHGAQGRAFGFALTFYPSVLALVASAVAIVSDGFA